jgi:hypothetical protein
VVGGRWRCSSAGGTAPSSIDSRRSPSRSDRYRRECGPPPGCGSAWRERGGRAGPGRGRRCARGCHGQWCSGRRWITRSGSSPSPNLRRCWAWTRPGSGRPRWLPEGSGAEGLILWRWSDPWETGFVDLVGNQALLGQVDGRTSAAVRPWLLGRSPEFRDAIDVVVIDPHAATPPPCAPRCRTLGSRWTIFT